MNMPKTVGKRKKMNFMLGEHIITELQMWIPSGKRSDFVNGALEIAIRHYKREQAFKMMDELREKMKIKMSTKEMIKLKNYGRP